MFWFRLKQLNSELISREILAAVLLLIFGLRVKWGCHSITQGRLLKKMPFLAIFFIILSYRAIFTF
ncbi:MAG: hypothetical protein ACI9O6_002036 [Glaciecola sp.]|jgi:hypothetical protein